MSDIIQSEEIELEVLPHQMRFMDAIFEDKYRYVAFISGLGAGKSTAGAMASLRMIDEYRAPGCVIAPDFTTLNDSTLEAYKKHFESMGVDFRISFSGAKKRMIVNGVDVYLRSLNHHSQIAGLPDIGWIHIDEASKSRNIHGFKEAQGRLRKAETKKNQNWPMCMFITGTPHGKDHVYKFFVEEPLSDPEKKKERWIMYGVDSEENVFLDDAYIHALDTDYSGRFRMQQKQGLFVQMEGAVWEPYISIPTFIRENGRILFTGPVDLCVDFGFRRPAVLFVSQFYDPMQRRMIDFIFDAILPENMKTSELIKKVINVLESDYEQKEPGKLISSIYCDPAGDSQNTRTYLTDVGEFKQAFPGAKMKYSHQVEFRSIERGIQAVDNSFEKKNLAISKLLEKKKKDDYTDVISALSSVRYPEIKTGVPLRTYYEKDQINDHPADALRYRQVFLWLEKKLRRAA